MAAGLVGLAAPGFGGCRRGAQRRRGIRERVARQSVSESCNVELMTGLDRTRFASGVSMLSICTADGCTTIVFGRGTCVEHDLRNLTMAERLLTEAVARSQRTEHPRDTFDPR